MNLSEWANLQRVHPQTASRWLREGPLPAPARNMGRLILVGDLDTSSSMARVTVLYARVPSGDQRADLVRDMTEVLTSFCARLYGRRAAAHRAAKALAATQESVDAA